MLMNQFGFLWLAVTLGCLGRLLYELAFSKGYCNGLQEVEDDRISSILQEINESFGFGKKPRFFVSHRLTSPISMGMHPTCRQFYRGLNSNTRRMQGGRGYLELQESRLSSTKKAKCMRVRSWQDIPFLSSRH
jgi:hypothetical protein